MTAAIPTTSRSIAVRPDQPGKVHYTSVPLPDPEPQDVVVKVIRVGVCGTDREIIHGLLGTPPDGSDELVIGHEVLGRVVTTGYAVTDLKSGDLVSATVRRPDGCPACQAGQPDMCLWREYEERGIAGQHGFMTEYFIESRKFIVPVPDALEHVGVLIEPLTVVEKAVRQADLIQQRMAYWNLETAVVLGAGPIGMLGSLLLRSRDIDVTTVARTPKPNPAASIIEASGASYVSTEVESLHELHQRLDNIDLILESTGASSLAFDAMTMLGTNGVLVLLSLTGGDGTAEVPTAQINTGLVAGNKTVVGSVNAGIEDFTNAVDHLGRFEELWPGLLERMFTDRIPFDAALGSIAAKADQGIKTLIEFS
jgi:threonine dehydrogenase-like Zn-dependent dehydrogenase